MATLLIKLDTFAKTHLTHQFHSLGLNINVRTFFYLFFITENDLHTVYISQEHFSYKKYCHLKVIQIDTTTFYFTTQAN
jgi:hypothetical protein